MLRTALALILAVTPAFAGGLGEMTEQERAAFRAEVKAGLAATETPVTPATPKKYYRVQLGAFSVKANADAMLTKVKAAGFTDAFVKYSE